MLNSKLNQKQFKHWIISLNNLRFALSLFISMLHCCFNNFVVLRKLQSGRMIPLDPRFLLLFTQLVPACKNYQGLVSATSPFVQTLLGSRCRQMLGLVPLCVSTFKVAFRWLLWSRRIIAFKSYLCSYKHIFKEFSLVVRNDGRCCKNYFLQGLIVYQTTMFHQYLF